jgi:alpha-tubulin suppressor-like RCC1 family protein
VKVIPSTLGRILPLLCLFLLQKQSLGETWTNAFSPAITIGTEARGIAAVGDFNNDNRLDLIATNISTGLVLYENRTDGANSLAFEPRTNVLKNPLIGSPYVADLDQDGQLDLVMGWEKGISAYTNTLPIGQLGPFAVAAIVMTNSGTVSQGSFKLFIMDLDGDGKPEIATTSTAFTVYPNTSTSGAVSFGPGTNILTTLITLTGEQLIFADFDSDGKPDIYYPNTSQFYRNTSTPGYLRFETGSKLTPGLRRRFTDLTGDQKPDLYTLVYPLPVFHDGPPGGTISISKNLSSVGNITFGPAVTNLLLIDNASLADLDGDGRLDFFEVNTNSLLLQTSRIIDLGDRLHVELADPVIIPIAGNLIGALLYADFNGDGRIDISVSPRIESPKIFLNQIIAKPILQIDVPAHSHRVVQGENVDVYAAAFPRAQIARIDAYLDGQFHSSTTSNYLHAVMQLSRTGMVTVKIDAIGLNGNILATDSRQVMVLEELNLPVRPRSLPSQGFSSSSYVIDTNGEICAFGPNSSGQLGIGRISGNEFFPGKVQRPDSVTGWFDMAAGLNFALGVSTDQKLYVWGDNRAGQLGIDGVTNIAVPTLLTNLAAKTFQKVAAGSSHALALTSDGELWVWGTNSFGQLGSGNTNSTTTPQSIPFPAASLRWTNVFAGADFSFAIASDGTAYAWGRNAQGQLGLGHTNEVFSPALLQLPNGNSLRQISAGTLHSTALAQSGKIFCWGYNSGFLGLGDDQTNFPTIVSAPLELPEQKSWTKISASGSLTLALDASGAIYAWGPANFLSGITNWPTPLVLTNVPAWTDVAAGSGHQLAIGADGFVYSWGIGNNGALGNGSATFGYRQIPEKICSLDNLCPDTTNFPPNIQVSWPSFGDLLPGDGMVNIHADVSDPDGFIDSVQLYQVTFPTFLNPGATNLLLTLDRPPYNLSFSNTINGQLFIKVTDNTGATKDSSSGTITFPKISSLSAGLTNPFTQLREWYVTVSAGGRFALQGVGVIVTNLPTGARVLNATGETNGYPLLQHNFSMSQASSVRFTIEMDGDIPSGFIPGVAISNYKSDPLPDLAPMPIQQIGGTLIFTNGFGFEFPTVAGAKYGIEYSSTLSNWLASPVYIQSNGSSTRWFDNGPPKTSSPLSTHRYYRLRRAE